MVKVSRPLAADSIVEYHEKALGALSPERSYYTKDAAHAGGEWFGEQAEILQLVGKPVTVEDLRAVAEGKDPNTGEQLIKWRQPAKEIEPRWMRETDAWRGHLEETFTQAIEEGRFKLDKPGPTIKSARRDAAVFQREPRQYSERERQLLEIHKVAQELFVENLEGPGGEGARNYLKRRGMEEATVKEFGMGLAGESGTQLAERLQERGYSPELIEASGLILRRDGKLYDRFRDRMMFPIHAEDGNVIAFAGRKSPLDDSKTAKYINSPETEIYRKGEVLFNAHRAAAVARESGRVIVVEGQLDAMAVHQAGVTNVVALGGSALTEKQAASLREIAGSVVMHLDTDDAGKAAVERSMPILLDRGFSVSNLSLPDDPAKWLQEHKSADYVKAVRKASPLVQYLGEQAREQFLQPGPGGVVDPYAKVDAIRHMMATLEHVQPELRDEVSRQLQSYLHEATAEKEEKPQQMEHRAAWDMTISASKSVSVTALVAADDRVRVAHEESSREAAAYGQRSIQAKMGGLNAPQTTGRMVAALFQHDTARPVDGYAAPQLHTHMVIFNMSQDATGKYRALSTRELFLLQWAVEAVYQNGMALRLKALGYELEYGKGMSVEIKGYTEEYLAAESPRTSVIEREKELRGMHGPAANQIISLESREKKLDKPAEEIRAEHLAHAEKFGNQPEVVRANARERERIVYSAEFRQREADVSLRFAIRRLSERTTVMEDHEIHREALRHGRGYITLPDVEGAFQRSLERSEFVQVEHWRAEASGNRWTTPELIQKEREILAFMAAGRDRVGAMLPADLTKDDFREQFRSDLNNGQKHLVWNLLHSTDRITGVQGLAGTGKTKTLSVFRGYVERYGYEVLGLAATSTAVGEMSNVGIEARTMASFVHPASAPATRPRAYFVDESSLVDVHAFAAFVAKVKPADRVFVIGDRKQHGSLGAGRVFAELQQAGMQTYGLSEIVRQQTPVYREEVKMLAAGKISEALASLDDRGRIHVQSHEGKRFAAIAAAVLKADPKALVVSPDNRSRQDISAAIRAAKQEAGQVGANGYRSRVLNQRSDMGETASGFAAEYRPGDVVRFSADLNTGIKKGDYASVLSADRDRNEVTVMRESDGQVFTYNPERTAKGATVFEPADRQFAVGDRVQFTRQWKEYIPSGVKGQPGKTVVHAANRALATIERIDESGNITVRKDKDGELLSWNLDKMPHLDYGYVMTSYSSQSVTAPEVLIHLDTDAPGASRLLSQQLIYVAWSRGRNDVTIFANSREELDHYLSRSVVNATALDPQEVRSYRPQSQSQGMAVA